MPDFFGAPATQSEYHGPRCVQDSFSLRAESPCSHVSPRRIRRRDVALHLRIRLQCAFESEHDSGRAVFRLVFPGDTLAVHLAGQYRLSRLIFTWTFNFAFGLPDRTNAIDR